MITKKDRYISLIIKITKTSTSRRGVIKKITTILDDNTSRHEPRLITTPNPEILMLAKNDPALLTILENSTLAIPDGLGIIAAEKFLLLPAPKTHSLRLFVLIAQGLWVGGASLTNNNWQAKTIPGRLIYSKLIKQAKKKKWKVFLLGGQPGTAEKLIQQYQAHEVNTIGTSDLYIDSNGHPVNSIEAKKEKQIIKTVNQFKPDLLFVAFGAPKQEKWLARNLKRLNTKIAMTVGGAFDYYSGRQALPPAFFKNFGLEWFWRFLTQPTRFKRIIRAVVIFPLTIFQYRLKHPNFAKS